MSRIGYARVAVAVVKPAQLEEISAALARDDRHKPDRRLAFLGREHEAAERDAGPIGRRRTRAVSGLGHVTSAIAAATA